MNNKEEEIFNKREVAREKSITKVFRIHIFLFDL